MSALHWGWFDRHEWDGNPEATEPRERHRPACNVKADDPQIAPEGVFITCKYGTPTARRDYRIVKWAPSGPLRQPLDDLSVKNLTGTK